MGNVNGLTDDRHLHSARFFLILVIIKGYSTFVCPPPPDPPWGGGGGDPYIIQIGGRGGPLHVYIEYREKTLSEGGTHTKSKLGGGGDPYTFCRGGVRPQGANESGIALNCFNFIFYHVYCKKYMVYTTSTNHNLVILTILHNSLI